MSLDQLFASSLDFGISSPIQPRNNPRPPEFSITTETLLKKSKKVENKVRPVKTTLPERFRVIRCFPSDPLKDMIILPDHPPPFSPAGRLTQERYNDLGLDNNTFLWPEEQRLLAFVLRTHEQGLAWEASERGSFREDYFAPIVIPVLEHIPWVQKNIPIPPGIFDAVIRVLKEKIAAGVLEPSNSSYRSPFFCVVKKDGTSLRLVHNLQAVNRITIQDNSVPPTPDSFAELHAGRSAYTLLDLFVGFDHRALAEESRDLTTFMSPLGSLRLTKIPMGATNSMQIMQGDLTFILQAEMPHICNPFIDDIPVIGPPTRYECSESDPFARLTPRLSPLGFPDDPQHYETIPTNPGIRRFIWEHANNLHRVMQRLQHAGATVSAKKLQVCGPDGIVVGHKCTYHGREPSDSTIQKIRDWPACTSLSELRGFLGMCGVVRIWIKDFATIARALVLLTKKDVPFEWGDTQQEAMQWLKDAVLAAPCLRPIDYNCGRPVILAVDSSYIAVGFILFQLGADNKRYPARFSSITWNDRESRYSQAKLELYGLFRALRASRSHIIGIPEFTIEVDAKYIKGMLNNPDIQPNAAINRWIAGILLFPIKLVHVPAAKHTGADGMSRRPRAPEDPVDPEDIEDWLDDALGFAVETANTYRINPWPSLSNPTSASNLVSVLALADQPEDVSLPSAQKAAALDARILLVQTFLQSLVWPPELSDVEYKQFLKYASGFFLSAGNLMRRDRAARHKVVIPPARRAALLAQIHDDTGHKGVYSTRVRLADRFWWPHLSADVKWWCRTCHVCQLRQLRKIHIPPVIIPPALLFRKVHIDTFLMPLAAGYRYVVHARDSLSAWPEWRALRVENERTLAAFIFEDILCRWGALAEIVTDNGSAFIAATSYLALKYGVKHIRISGYNSQANGIAERRHFDVREALVKTADHIDAHWPAVAPAVFWAERITVGRSVGYSPFWIAHGVEPLHPFDISEATYLLPPLALPASTTELVSYRARQLMKREADLEMIHSRVLKSRQESIAQFVKRFERSIFDYVFEPGTLVLVRNTRVEKELNRKTKPRYLGPMIVIRKTFGGSYILAEPDGALSKLQYTAFRIIPYYARDSLRISVTRLLDTSDAALDNLARASETPDDEDVAAFDEDSD